MPETRTISLSVNGHKYEKAIEPRMLLVDFLRQTLDLTGTHVGCEHGVCGACTILIDGQSARSCLMFAVQAKGRELTTIEGLANADGTLSILQQAFHEKHGLQCGFCTPGMLITLTEHLRENPDPTEEELRTLLTGNICRCTGYQAIVEAGLDAAQKMRVAQAEGV
ncbi:MAG: aerobic-type carbon monoxide dehydrogenase, small subunit CoxS/CutS-like protein [Hyphomicrobiales bacterium]|nr:aerobic-type carbon monoxide dehydrogenase, small subunit CoxS/CutS-like protein [Hyphomicrobiales bacterium]